MMRRKQMWVVLGMALGSVAGLAGPNVAKAQESLATIDADFERESAKLQKMRLERLARLATSKTGAEAELAYETYFRSAIANSLYSDAEATAETVMKSGTASAQVAMLAHLVNVIAEADRGDFEESVKDLEAALKASQVGQKSSLPVALKLTLLDAFLQRLVHGGQFDIAKKCLQTLIEKAEDASVKDLATQWLKQVELVGKAAPSIEGKDVDGKPFRLADTKGDVVLVVFWATWCLGNAQEVAALDQAYSTHKAKGLRIVGVNVDAFQDDGRSTEDVMPAVKRFLIEYNVRWPNLVDHTGEGEIAKAYGVKDIPSNVLIGRDGTVVQFNMTRANLNKVLAKEMAR